jgi:hypothetical protein
VVVVGCFRILAALGCKEWLLKRSLHSDTNLITELEVFPKDSHNYLRKDHDTYLHLHSLVTLFIAEEGTVIIRRTPSKRLGKSGLKVKKEFIFVQEFCVSLTHRGPKDAAIHVKEFLKAWTVQAEP